MSSYDNMAARLTNPASKIEGSFATDNLRAVAAELDDIKDFQIDYMPNRFFPTLASGDDLTLAAANFGVDRKPAACAEVILTITGDEGTVIDSEIKAAAGDLVFCVGETVTIDAGGVVDVTAVAEEAGSSGNVLPGMINEFIDTYDGLAEVVNNQAASGGADEESDEDLLIRVKARWQAPSTGGNKYDYERWALEVPGVSRAKAFSHSPGNVTVYIVAANNAKADDSLCGTVKEYIEPLRPVGANVNVVPAEPVTINIDVAVTLLDGHDLESVRDRIISSLRAYLSSISFTASVVSYAKLANLMFVDGVADVNDYTMNGGKSSVPLGVTQFPVEGVFDVKT